MTETNQMKATTQTKTNNVKQSLDMQTYLFLNTEAKIL